MRLETEGTVNCCRRQPKFALLPHQIAAAQAAQLHAHERVPGLLNPRRGHATECDAALALPGQGVHLRRHCMGRRQGSDGACWGGGWSWQWAYQ